MHDSSRLALRFEHASGPARRWRAGFGALGALGALAALVALGVGFGCSSSDDAPPPATTTQDGGTPDAPGAPAVSFRVQALEGCGAAGTQSVVAVSGSKVAFASLAATEKSNPCTTMNGVASVQVWDVCYAASDGQGKYTTKVVTSQPYLTPTGLGLAFDPAGEANLAFTGGGPAALRCGATELFLAKTAGGTFGAPAKIASGSAGTPVADQASNCVQNVCNSGDATGFWPSIGFDSAGKSAVVFRDLHFGFAFDDFASSDVEFGPGPGFSSLTTIDVSRGGGTYLRLAFTPAGKAAVAHYAGDGSGSKAPAIWLNRQTDAGWESQKIADGKIGEQLGFAVSAKGLFALAYYDEGATRLRYLESSDGATWSAPANVDLDGSTGFYPTLAFDPAGDPAIAYYRCNAKGPSESNCDASHDGLYLARRKSGSWQVQAVRAESGIFEGLYPALAFVNGKAAIAYQARSFDLASKQNTVTWWVAEEP